MSEFGGRPTPEQDEWDRLRAREELSRWRMDQDKKALKKSTETWWRACRELLAYDRKLRADV